MHYVFLVITEYTSISSKSNPRLLKLRTAKNHLSASRIQAPFRRGAEEGDARGAAPVPAASAPERAAGACGEGSELGEPPRPSSPPSSPGPPGRGQRPPKTAGDPAERSAVVVRHRPPLPVCRRRRRRKRRRRSRGHLPWHSPRSEPAGRGTARKAAVRTAPKPPQISLPANPRSEQLSPPDPQDPPTRPPLPTGAPAAAPLPACSPAALRTRGVPRGPQHGSARPGTARHGLARLSTARHGSARLGTHLLRGASRVEARARRLPRRGRRDHVQKHGRKKKKAARMLEVVRVISTQLPPKEARLNAVVHNTQQTE
ncbi:nascent polypeptide-associated complex subunit alpha, muscle-specific form-like [Cygnus olor]|uniref:nascent polypeptide-associated complex subunit alpha, muscle-specific form-like n=1 Tax=Cygnus olor TaxID=8869 RepID=UPI001ADE041E|nr:nascent polypeptide-associated complex subunit alpha, muscle-specific form-like [Cygnus olor]